MARFLAFLLPTVGYVVAAQWLMTAAPPSPWNAVGVLAPMLGSAGWAAWRAGQRWRGAVGLAAVGLLVVLAARDVQLPSALLYLTQHVVVHLALAAWFAATLRGDGPALISGLAARLHGRLSPAMSAYTRKVTRAWVAYFLAMALASVGLYAAAPFDVWATFANVGTPLAVVAMFLGEWLLRYRLHPEFERSSVADAVRAWRQRAAPVEPEPPR